jgi:RNA polymerase sigma-70 factor (ECF subfamily)
MSTNTDENLQAILEHLPRMHARARVLAGNHADAADLVQDTLEKALRALPRLRPGSNVGAWLGTLLTNTFIDEWRSASHRVTLASTAPLDLPAPEHEPPPPRWLDITQDQVRAAVDRLSPDFAEVFRMHVFEHLPYEVIASRLGIPTGTVGTRLARARWRLRGILASGPGVRQNVEREGDATACLEAKAA